MAKHETSWILELVDNITKPLRNITGVTDETRNTVDKVTASIGDLDEETRAFAERSLKSHRELSEEIQKEQNEIKKLTNWLEDLGDQIDPLKKAQIDFDIKQAQTKARRYQEQLVEIEHELKQIENAPDKKKMEANWGAAVVVANQTAELVEKALGTFDFAVGIEATRTQIQRLTGESGDRLDELTAKAHRLGKVYKEDPAEIAKAANVMTQQIGGSFDENFALIEAGYQKGANLNGDFLDQLKEYPTFIKQVGLSASEMVAITAQANKEGVFSDKALDSIKEANLSLREMGQPQIDALKGIGLEAKDLADKTAFEAVQMISRSMDGATDQAKQLVLADIFKGAGEDAGLGWVEGLGSIDMDINKIESVQEAGAGIRGWLAGLESSFANTFGSIVTNANELSGVTTMIASMIPIIQTLSKVTWVQNAATKAMTAVQWLWNVALNANPIGLVIAGVAALVGVVTWAWSEFEGFRKIVMGVWEVMKLFAVVIKDLVIQRLKDMLSGITGLGSALMKFFKGDWEGAWEAGKQAVTDLSGIEAGTEALGKLSTGIADAYATGAEKGAESWAADQEKEKQTTGDYDFSNIAGTEAPTLDGLNKINTPSGSGLGSGGASAPKMLNVTLNVNNNFDVKDGADFINKRDEILDYIVGRMNDTLKDALIAAT